MPWWGTALIAFFSVLTIVGVAMILWFFFFQFDRF